MNMSSMLRNNSLKPANHVTKDFGLFFLNPEMPFLSENILIYRHKCQNKRFPVPVVFPKGQKNPLYQTGLFSVNYLRRSKPRLNTALIATR